MTFLKQGSNESRHLKDFDCVVIGGGASGMAAAIFCAERGKRVLILEKAPRVGKKLLATGNGTCNITNIHAEPKRYHAAADFVCSALSAFPPSSAIDFFERIGVSCVTRDNGRVYPRCEQAGAVLDCLRLTMEERGVTVRCDSEVTAITPCQGGWQVTANGETVSCRNVIVATGGAAAPALGGSAACYALPLSAGHQKTPLYPAIVQVRTDTTYIRAMKGLRTDATVTFAVDGNPVAAHTDELLFTEYGISGPAVMQISRAVGDWERRKKGTMSVSIDFLPTLSHDTVWDDICRRRETGRRVEDLLTGLLHKRIGQTVCRMAGLSLAESGGALTDAQLSRLCDTIKTATVSVIGTQGFGGAQVTAGGIERSEICPETMESKKAKGLYLLGEVLDVDGECGGFNLQWAWSSAYTAACAIAEETV